MASRCLLLLSLIAFGHVSGQSTVAANATCYWPDGTVAKGPVPCTNFVQDGAAACCWWENMCTSNGFCIDTVAAFFYRGACTATDWTTTNACPDVCTNEHYVPVLPCETSGNFACGTAEVAAATCNGSVQGEFFNVGQITPLGIQIQNEYKPDVEISHNYPASLTVYNQAVSRSLSSSTATQSGGTDTAATVTTTVTATATGTGTGSSGSSSSTVAIVGGVLGALLAVSLAAILWLALLLVKARRQSPSDQHKPMLQHDYKDPRETVTGRQEVDGTTALVELGP